MVGRREAFFEILAAGLNTLRTRRAAPRGARDGGPRLYRQFAHLATFSETGTSRSRPLADVIAEAARLPGAAPHVPNPGDAHVIQGVPPTIVGDELRAHIAEAKAAGQRVRRNTHTLATVIASYPVPFAEVAASDRLMRRLVQWVDAVGEWADQDWRRRHWRLRCLVFHGDETYPNLHALGYADPDVTPRLDAREGHPGWRARRADPANASRAYRAAMSAWQDAFWQGVSLRFGHARFGSRRRRLDRADYLRHKAEVRATEIAIEARRRAEADAERILREAESRAAETVRRAEAAADALRGTSLTQPGPGR